jgi:excisionase family DNA binding protein
LTDRLLTAGELADRLQVPETWVRAHTRNGHLPAVRLGRYWRYQLKSVQEYLEKQEQGGEPWRKHRPARPAA